MNWILALFAFAGVMAVMSTVVSVCVEAIHKFFGLRGSGMKDMLQALHDGVIMPMDPGHPDVQQAIHDRKTREGDHFAKAMTRSPSYGKRSTLHWMANIPLFGTLRRRFQNLSKLQFVEQLSLTDYGQRLASRDREEVRDHLNRAVYEFERYGAAQTDYFRARAKILTTVVALLIVVVGNFNAISIYLHLATNQSAVHSLKAMVTSNPEMIQKMVETRMDRAADQGGVLNAAASDSSGANDQKAKETAQQIATQLVTDIRDLSDMGFPIGRSHFPYCGDTGNNGCNVPTWSLFKVDPNWVADNLWYVDANPDWLKENPAFVEAHPTWRADLAEETELRGKSSRQLADEIQPVRYFPLFGYNSQAIPRFFTPEGLQWFIGMLATAGLIGLGAPFWFGLFQSLASIALRSSPQLAAMNRAQTSQAVQVAPGEVRRPKEASGSLAAPGSEPDLDLLTDAFMTVNGKMAGATPVGRKLGLASADRIAASGSNPPVSTGNEGGSTPAATRQASVGATTTGAPAGEPQTRGIRKFRSR